VLFGLNQSFNVLTEEMLSQSNFDEILKELPYNAERILSEKMKTLGGLLNTKYSELTIK
jgi:hypothetical protein